MRQKNTQLNLDFHSAPTDEARQASGEATESLPTVHVAESPASTNQLMEEVCERENLKQALQQVKANKGSPGIDGMTVEELPGYLQQHWPAIREQLLNGTYEPKPVRRVEIEKPDGGGMRKLGILTTLDCNGSHSFSSAFSTALSTVFSESSPGCALGDH
jgi:RNA-directed DNA polymerase